jgi:hypothetical protein
MRRNCRNRFRSDSDFIGPSLSSIYLDCLFFYSQSMSRALARAQQQLSQFTRPPLAKSSSPRLFTMSVRKIHLGPLVLATAIIALLLNKFMQAKTDSITDWVKPGDKSGEFKRPQSQFRNWISRESGAEFPPEKDRYHLYVSYACPWGEFFRSDSRTQRSDGSQPIEPSLFGN